jgi:hypothetical protein
LAVAVERLEETVAQLLELRVEFDEGHLHLGVGGDGVPVAVKVGGHLGVVPCGGRVVIRSGRRAVAFVGCRGALAVAGCCGGALLADIGQRRLDPDKRRVQQPGERGDDVATSGAGDTGEQHVSKRAKVEVGPAPEVV